MVLEESAKWSLGALLSIAPAVVGDHLRRWGFFNLLPGLLARLRRRAWLAISRLGSRELGQKHSRCIACVLMT